ncbi:MAG: hypothetical protein KBT33_09610 [Prevotellaceae bacterium]|nr:hypothetical protein [Candidatus Minthosoma equi]
MRFNFNQCVLKVFMAMVLMTMAVCSNAKNDDFPKLLKKSLETFQKETDLDPMNFPTSIKKLEKSIGNRTDAVERSVANAQLAVCYKEMVWTAVTDFDEETRKSYTDKSNEYFNSVLTDIEALANASSKDYKDIVKLQDDSKLYNHDMLSVLTDFLEENSNMSNAEKMQMLRSVSDFYKKKGNKNAYALMKSGALNYARRVSKGEGYISGEQLKDSIYALFMEVKDEEVGADLIVRYSPLKENIDEEIVFLRWALENVGASDNKNAVKNKLADRLKPQITISCNDVLVAGQPVVISANYWNCDGAVVNIRQFDGYKDEKTKYDLKLTGSIVESRELVFGKDEKNMKRRAENLPVKGDEMTSLTLPAGRYVVEMKGLGFTATTELCVTSMRLMYLTGKKFDLTDVIVLNNETGRPMEGVTIEGKEYSYYSKQDSIFTIGVTGKDGCITLGKNMNVRALKSDRDFTSWTRANARVHNYQSDNPDASTHIYNNMDRGLYRPGQKVYGSIVVYNQITDETEVSANKHIALTVKDARNKKIDTIEFVTNEWGSGSYEFTLPDDANVGKWNLVFADKEDDYSAAFQFSVEEYKRPTFEVEFNDEVNLVEAGSAKRDKENVFVFGDSIATTGVAKMFNGVPVQSARVHYTVEYGMSSFWVWWRRLSWNFMQSGELTTDDDGKFRVPIMLTDQYLKDSDMEVMNFRVKATVTDVAGESHENEWCIRISNKEFGLEVRPDDYAMDKQDASSFIIKAVNANNKPVDVEGEYAICANGDTVCVGAFKSNEKIKLSASLKAGVKYSVLASAKDSKGSVIENNRNNNSDTFVLYDSSLQPINVTSIGTKENKREKADVEESDWMYAKETHFSENGSVDIYFSTAQTDAFVIMNVYGNEGLLDRYTFVTDGKQKKIRLRHRKEWGDGIYVTASYVRNGHSASYYSRFERVAPEKKLDVSWASFRDKLQPGQKETWTLTVKKKDGTAVGRAEMMATMYDAALDRISRYPYDWDFGVWFGRNVPFASIVPSNGVYLTTRTLSGHYVSSAYHTRRYDEMMRFAHDRYYSVKGGGRKAKVMMAAATRVEESAVYREMANTEMASVDGALQEKVGGLMVVPAEEASEPDIMKVDYSNAAVRTDFSETAFFFPHLMSDSKGNVQISFTVPESLTEWKFLGLVHTKDVNYGKISATATVKKSFMVRPNMPRFLRWGDSAEITTSIINQSETELKGGVRMRLINPETGDVAFEQEKAFAMDAGKTIGVSFDFVVKEGWEGFDCEIVAVSDGTSDGERNYLPILSTKKQIVEAVPFYLVGNADGVPVEKDYDLSALFNQNSSTAARRKLKVEYTDNPSWMCIEALKGVSSPCYDDAVSYATSLYANGKVLELANTFPVIITKNEDLNAMTRSYEKAKQKLVELQKADGGWSWFKGMESSRYITMAVCEQLARVEKPSDDIAKMLDDGLSYLDSCMLGDYELAKKNKRKVYPSNSVIDYLSLVSKRIDTPVSKKVVKMRNAYVAKVKKMDKSNMTIYGAANVSLMLRTFGKKTVADRLVNYIKDYTVSKPNQGRFFATDAAYYSWMDYRIPTQVAAMYAIYAKDRNDAYLNEMQLWLLCQKQVQKWDSPMNTIDVVDLLMKISGSETFHETKLPEIKIDDVVVDKFDYGTINDRREEIEGKNSNLILQGNVIADVSDNIIADGVKSMNIKKTSPSVSWGAAYAVYQEDINNVNFYSTNELKIDRKLYIKKINKDDWEEFQDGMMLNVGDKVRVRSIVSSDRDMDFVHVNVQIPACLEPERTVSGYQYMGGRSCYLAIHDSSYDMFFDWFTRGTATTDMDYTIVRAGTYNFGISTAECEYAKQFGGHTNGLSLKIAK